MRKLYHFLLYTIPRPVLIRCSLFLKAILGLLLRGHKFTDPINGKSYSYFLPYGQLKGRRRNNVLSPGTLSLERHRLMWLYLAGRQDFQKNKIKVLHIAPEQCFYKYFRKMSNLEYITADYNSPIADMHFDLHRIPLDDDQFDVVFCNHVLEHVNDDRQCMQELFRVMKPGGWGIFQVPLDPGLEHTFEDPEITSAEERAQHFGQKDHVRLYGLDYKDRLMDAGFTVEVCNFIAQFTEAEIERYALQKGEQLYICSKHSG
ncbi:MAG: SAM-dependent methyltransferase [Bacteroidetes bacterium 43-16]|nr:MAG: SAM-dependent methyltransferase [Bacteroidetes bacterium 43-16]